MSDSMRLAVVIGMAMVLHKGPVSFGLVSYLVSRNCPLSLVWQVCRLTGPLMHTLYGRFARRLLYSNTRVNRPPMSLPYWAAQTRELDEPADFISEIMTCARHFRPFKPENRMNRGRFNRYCCAHSCCGRWPRCWSRPHVRLIQFAVAIGMAMVLHQGPVSFVLVSYVVARSCPLFTHLAGASPYRISHAYLGLQNCFSCFLFSIVEVKWPPHVRSDLFCDVLPPPACGRCSPRSYSINRCPLLGSVTESCHSPIVDCCPFLPPTLKRVSHLRHLLPVTASTCAGLAHLLSEVPSSQSSIVLAPSPGKWHERRLGECGPVGLVLCREFSVRSTYQSTFLSRVSHIRESLRTTRMQDLLIFSATSPLVAIASYLLLRQATGFGGAVGVALSVLFSAGTFVYAACVHLLPHASNLSTARLATLAVAAGVPCLLNSLGLHHH
jgi:hypothetical protein